MAILHLLYLFTLFLSVRVSWLSGVERPPGQKRFPTIPQWTLVSKALVSNKIAEIKVSCQSWFPLFFLIGVMASSLPVFSHSMYPSRSLSLSHSIFFLAIPLSLPYTNLFPPLFHYLVQWKVLNQINSYFHPATICSLLQCERQWLWHIMAHSVPKQLLWLLCQYILVKIPSI